MAATEFEEFVMQLAREVRDQAIEDCDRCRLLKTKGKQAERWRKLIESGSTNELLDAIIPDCIDLAIFFLLDAIDNEKIEILYAPDGKPPVNLCKSQELAGWYRSGEWIKKYSTQRFYDYYEEPDSSTEL